MRTKLLVMTLSLLALSSVPLPAQGLIRGIGIRGGLTLNPDQVHVGAHIDMGTFGQHVRLQPNIEVGFGDDVTSISLNPELIYLFLGSSQWIPYLGGGLGVTIYSFNPPAPAEDYNDTQTGVNLLGGIETKLTDNSRFFIEGKLGVGDIPDAKIAIGFTFLR